MPDLGAIGILPTSVVYAASTPPGPQSATITGFVYNQSGSPAARTVRAYRRSDGAFVSSTTSNGGTGAYTLTALAATEHFVVAFDDAGAPTENDLILRTTTA